MNKIMFDVLLLVNKGEKWNVKSFSKKLYKPYSIVEQEYKRLIHEGYIEDGFLTDKGYKTLNEHIIENAVILAAGVSSRFVPMCLEKPKGLLEVQGEILVERQIRQLNEIGIKEIIIVVGYMKEKFEYLTEKYGVKLIYTDTYKVRNNHASVLAAKKYLCNTIITSSDLYFKENIFQKYAYDSYYCTVYREGVTEERGIQTDNNDKFVRTFYNAADTWVTLGYAYFNKRFSDNYIKIVEKEYNYSETVHKFWADIQDEHLPELFMYAKRCDNNIIYEFDSLEELREFDISYKVCSKSILIKNIADRLSTTEDKLSQFKPIAKEDLGRGFTFTFDQKKYMCRIDRQLNVTILCRYDDVIQELSNLTDSFLSYHGTTLPLCAAENIVSKFANLPLTMGFQERYIVGNTYSFSESDNFIGSEYLLPFYKLISEKCENLFNAKYSDSRTLTGMNCLMMVLSALSKNGDKLLILGKEAGGHASVKPIAERLGLEVGEVPFDYDKQDLNYEELNTITTREAINFVLLAPSDIIKPFNIRKFNDKNTVLLYDVSQMLGLIAAGVIANPLDSLNNIVMFGGTHKTFPGPASGLILTNNDELHARLENTINPVFIRHTQMHQKVSLLFALTEFEVFGKAYEEHIVKLANTLGCELNKLGFNVGCHDGVYSHTHEVFIYTDKDMMERIYTNSMRLGITLNKKKKALFYGYGIRLGTQEIARYGWPEETMKIVAEIIYLLAQLETNDSKVRELINVLPVKSVQYTFDESVFNRFTRFVVG